MIWVYLWHPQAVNVKNQTNFHSISWPASRWQTIEHVTGYSANQRKLAWRFHCGYQSPWGPSMTRWNMSYLVARSCMIGKWSIQGLLVWCQATYQYLQILWAQSLLPSFSAVWLMGWSDCQKVVFEKVLSQNYQYPLLTPLWIMCLHYCGPLTGWLMHYSCVCV